jgi:pyruvate-ferredoxin/flavodoxin oxidoreductase
MLEYAVPGGTFLLNAPYPKDELWKHLPRKVQDQIVEKKLKVYVIDAYDVAEKTGMGGRINSIMQTCFFAISGVLPREEAIAQIKKAIEKTYGKKGAEVVKRNFAAVDATLANLHEVPVGPATGTVKMRPTVPQAAPDFVKRVQAVIIEGKGDLLPGERLPRRRHLAHRHRPVGEAQRSRSRSPSGTTRSASSATSARSSAPTRRSARRSTTPPTWPQAPATFKSTDFKGAEFKGKKYTIQVAPEDCTGCNLCVMVCPAKDKSNPKHKAIDMAPMPRCARPRRGTTSSSSACPSRSARRSSSTSRARSS